MNHIVLLFVGALVCVFGSFNIAGNIDSLHSYHKRRIKPEDVKPFGRLIGSGTFTVGASIIVGDVSYIFCEYFYF